MATQMITAYIGNYKVLVPKGVPVPGASLKPTGTVNTNVGPMTDAYIGGVKVKVPSGKDVYIKGATLDQKGSTPVGNNPIDEYIKSTGLPEAQQAILRTIAQGDQYTSGNTIPDDAKTAQILADAAKQAEIDIDPYYQKIKSQDLENIKTQMGDIRSAAARYTQEEQLSYKQKLRSAKESLAAQGMSFSGTARTQLGDQSIIGGAGVEGEMPQARRYAAENSLNKIAAASRDVGRAAEQKYGSSELGKIQGEFGTFAAPYDLANGNVTYNASRTSPLYSVSKYNGGNPDTGYVRSTSQTNLATGANQRYAASWDVERQAAIEREAKRRAATAGYTP